MLSGPTILIEKQIYDVVAGGKLEPHEQTKQSNKFFFSLTKPWIELYKYLVIVLDSQGGNKLKQPKLPSRFIANEALKAVRDIW